MIAEVNRWKVNFDSVDLEKVSIEFELDDQYGLEDVMSKLKNIFIIPNIESIRVLECKLVGHTNFKHTFYDVEPREREVKIRGNST